MTNFRKSIIYRMGFTFLTVCLYLARFACPLKSMSFQEVFKIEEVTKNTSQFNKRVHGIGSNENNLYLHKVLNKKVLNDFSMVKKKAFYMTPPFQPNSKVTTNSHNVHSEMAKKLQLEQFTMKRKEAFYITPPFDYETHQREPETAPPAETSASGSEKENEFYHDLQDNQKNLRAEDKHDVKSILDIEENPASIDKQKKPKPTIDTQDLNNTVPNIINGSVISNNDDKVAAKSYDYDITFNPFADQFVTPYIARNQESDDYNQNITDLANKQADIINQLNQLGGDKDKVDNYNQQFYNLMKALRFQKAWASSTVMIVLDENDVKKKLREDPFVQRVLKMAQRRKEEYFRRAKEESLKKIDKL